MTATHPLRPVPVEPRSGRALARGLAVAVPLSLAAWALLVLAIATVARR
jgi:hypothetical protein